MKVKTITIGSGPELYGSAEPASMKARSELLATLAVRIRAWEVTQGTAARRLGISRPRLNDLLQGKLAKFSLDALVNIATASGLTVNVQVVESFPPATRFARH